MIPFSLSKRLSNVNEEEDEDEGGNSTPTSEVAATEKLIDQWYRGARLNSQWIQGKLFYPCTCAGLRPNLLLKDLPRLSTCQTGYTRL